LAGLVHHLEIHENGQFSQKHHLEQIMTRHRSRLIDQLFPISQALAAVLVDAGAVAERVHVIPNGVDLEAFKQTEPFDAKRLDHPRIVYMGRISNDRGLAVFQALAERRIGNITLTGEQDDPHSASSSLRVEPFVPHRDVAKWYNRTDIVLLPYQAELAHADSISPLKLFEALAAGRPIIASNIPPIREILEHRKTALLVEPDNIDAWVGAIHVLRNDHVLATQIAKQAKELASSFSWCKRAARIARALGWNVRPC
jgi:glycosyltransferase involved in cell wall biosynthesis